MNNALELSGLLIALAPFIVNWFDKRNRLQKSTYLFELIKTDEELAALIDVKKEDKNSLILVKKLEDLKKDIENEINYYKKPVNYWLFIIIVSLESFIIYSNFDRFMLLLKRLGIYIDEGILEGEGRMLISMLSLIVLSIIATYSIVNFIQRKKPDFGLLNKKLSTNVIMVFIFNGLLILPILILAYLDQFVNWF